MSHFRRQASKHPFESFLIMVACGRKTTAALVFIATFFSMGTPEVTEGSVSTASPTIQTSDEKSRAASKEETTAANEHKGLAEEEDEEDNMSYMDQFAFKSTPAKLDVLRLLLAAHPDATRLDTVTGGGEEAAPVYALVVSEHASSRGFLVPRVQLSAGFPAGAGMLVRFARHLLERRTSDPQVAALLKHTELHLVFPFAGYRSASFHQVCVSDAGSDLVRLLNIDASVRDDSSASLAYSGTRSSDRLVLSGVLLTDGPTPLSEELDENQGPKAPDQDVFSHIASRFAEKQSALASNYCAAAGNGSAGSNRWFRRKVQSTLGALEKHAYAHRGILQSFLTVPCCSNVTKMRTLWPQTRNALMDFVLQPSEGVRGYVKDVRGTFVKHALLTVRGRPVGFWTSDQGEFWRMLRPGDYMVVASAPGYLPAAARFAVVEGQRWTQPVMMTLHFAPRTFPVLQIFGPPISYRSKNKTSDNRRPPPEAGSKTSLPSASRKSTTHSLPCLLLLLVLLLATL
ncbi:adipocyte enhancer-binding protein 1-like [Dermacentor albipictus]|uniref:adipocyte enhancer-binding protein 1-like n=1 Tax=Dermacentor albipictus TaxID=60249 RepID=UPI0038FCD97D